jgi:hypothetical protein
LAIGCTSLLAGEASPAAKVQVYNTFSLKKIPHRQAGGLFVREESYLVGEKVPGHCTFLLKENNTVYRGGFLLSPEQQPVPNKQQERISLLGDEDLHCDYALAHHLLLPDLPAGRAVSLLFWHHKNHQWLFWLLKVIKFSGFYPLLLQYKTKIMKF